MAENRPVETVFRPPEVAMVPFGRLLTALGDIPDPRRAQGKRYALPHLLLFSVLAVLAGASSYQGIITFIGIHRERLNHAFGARFRRPPALNTLRNLLMALDPADLEAAFRRHARDLHREGPETGLRTVALDGKTLRRSFDHVRDQAAAHVLSALATEAALVLAHCEVSGAPGEVAAAPELVAALGLTGVVFTADALHCTQVSSGVPPRPGTPCWSGSRQTNRSSSTALSPCVPRRRHATVTRQWIASGMGVRSVARSRSSRPTVGSAQGGSPGSSQRPASPV
jgi:hypothetical protein